MAIQTRGFDVSVMPKPGLADPSLVAFNPARIGQGMQEGLALADQLAKLKAYKLEQEEKAMLAADRLNAAKAQLKGIADQTPQHTRQITANADLAVNTTPGAISATNATNDRTTRVTPILAENDIMSAFAARPGIFSDAQVKSFDNRVKVGNAKIALDTESNRGAAAKAEAESVRVAKEGEAATAAEKADTAAIRSRLEKFAADDDAENFWPVREELKKQRELQTKTMEAQLANIQSQAQNNLAEAQMRLESVNGSKSAQARLSAVSKAAKSANDDWLKLMSTNLFDSHNQESNLMTYMKDLDLGDTDRIPAYDSLIKQAEELKAEADDWKSQIKTLTKAAASEASEPIITVPGMSGTTASKSQEGEDAVTYKTPDDLEKALLSFDITIAEHKKLYDRLFGKKK